MAWALCARWLIWHTQTHTHIGKERIELCLWCAIKRHVEAFHLFRANTNIIIIFNIILITVKTINIFKFQCDCLVACVCMWFIITRKWNKRELYAHRRGRLAQGAYRSNSTFGKKGWETVWNYSKSFDRSVTWANRPHLHTYIRIYIFGETSTHTKKYGKTLQIMIIITYVMKNEWKHSEEKN